jgi:hypothetical protein
MRFLIKFLLLVGVHKETDFFSMYDEGFLLIRCNSLEGAFAYLTGPAPIDAVLLDADHNLQRAVEYCEAIKRCKPATKVVVLSNPEVPLPENIHADLVVDSSLDEGELASQLVQALVPPHARDNWANGGRGPVRTEFLMAANS